MPLMRCGSDGWKYGDSGKCYEGPGGKKKAIKQGLAEHDGKWADASDKETEDLVKACKREDQLDRLMGKARIRFSQTPWGEMAWNILGWNLYFDSFDAAFSFKNDADRDPSMYRVALADPQPYDPTWKLRLLLEAHRVNPVVQNTQIINH